MPKNLKIFISAFLEFSIMVASVILIINLYDRQPVTLKNVNANLNVGGVVLTMPERDLFKLLGNKYKVNTCIEGHEDIYEKLSFTAVIDDDTKKVKAIITENDKHSLYDIKKGTPCSQAEQLLVSKGFLTYTNNKYQYIKDDVVVKLIYNEDKNEEYKNKNEDKNEDKTIKGFMVESLSI